MKILVCPAVMEIGGSQSNAVELARGVADLGHEVVLFGPDGELLELVRELDLEYVFAPRECRWPSRRNIAVLNRLVRVRGIDVVHGYEWGPAMDLAYGPHLRWGTPLVTTVMSMTVPKFLPRHAPLIVGTQELLAEHARNSGPVHLMEPPIDTVRNASSDPGRARARFGFEAHEVVLTVVCRLVTDLQKLEGVLEAMSVVGELAGDFPVRLLVVGGGEGLAEVVALATEINSSRGTDTVVVTGGLLDPRDAYDAADVVLGMGGSALKGLAFGKALVVQGRDGFWRLMDESSLPTFLFQGWYGASGGGRADLIAILRPLLVDAKRRARLGALGRAVVVDRFSIGTASANLIAIYASAIEDPPSRPDRSRSLARTSLSFTKSRISIARQQRIASASGFAPQSGRGPGEGS